MTDEITPQEYYLGFPEAPSSDTIKWVDKHGFTHLTTMRDWTFTALMSRVVRATEAIMKDGGLPEKEQKVMAAPVTQIQERGDQGEPVVDPEGKPVMINLPTDHMLCKVKGFYHGKNQKGDKTFLKVVLVDEPYNSKFGFAVFHTPFSEWREWPVHSGSDTPAIYAPPAGCKHVIVKKGEKYPEILEFRE